MTSVTATTSSTAASSAKTTAATASGTTVDYNSFLKLLVQELKNQDPTSPSDPTQYLSQIATFSNVEQGVNTNTKLSSLLTTASLTQAESTIGRKVTSADGSVSGTVSSVALGSDGTATASLTSGSTLTLDSSVVIGDGSKSSTSSS